MNLDQSVFTAVSPENPVPSFLNVGTGRDQTISETAAVIQNITEFTGETLFDTTKPDGTPKKLLDTNRINTLGWHPRYSLHDGLKNAYEWYLQKAGQDHPSI